MMSVFKSLFGKKGSSCCDIKIEEVKPEKNCCQNERTDVRCDKNKEIDIKC